MQKWKLKQYTIIDDVDNICLGNLSEHKIIIIDNQDNKSIMFTTESVGLLNEILQIIVFIFDFQKKSNELKSIMKNAMISDKDYSVIMKQSLSLQNFLQKEWVDTIRDYLNLD